MASGSGWNLWVWLLGVVVRRYIDFLILLIPTPLVSVIFSAASLLFVHKKMCFLAIVDQLNYVWVKLSHAMALDQMDYLWVKFSHAMVVPVV